MTVPEGGSTTADNPPPPRGEWPDDSRAGAVTDVPLLSRTAHDRGHLERLLPDPSRGRPVRVLLVDDQRTVPVHEGPHGPELVYDERAAWPEDAIYLGEADGVPYAALRAPRPGTVGGRPVDTWTGLRQVGAQLGDLDAGLLSQAIGIIEWHERNRFSPITGAPTTVERAGWAQHDPASGREIFPRTDPAVIMLVHDGGDRCVLGRQATWPAGRYSILAGFVEPGESAEAAVAREVEEEVGIGVTDVRYVSSQPWPFPQSLMLGYVARATDLQLVPDHDEIEEARWFSRDELRSGTGPQALPPNVSIARHIIDRWVAGELS
ncbi:NAD(+) diphosphatase [Modestobacter sp. SSW1-42]|uniref:NAD(+) diphosphatase n=1 Tax=Modestobacter sp. SSW1-42 TaxID=596372 RepID=UPI00398665C3